MLLPVVVTAFRIKKKSDEHFSGLMNYLFQTAKTSLDTFTRRQDDHH